MEFESWHDEIPTARPSKNDGLPIFRSILLTHCVLGRCKKPANFAYFVQCLFRFQIQQAFESLCCDISEIFTGRFNLCDKVNKRYHLKIKVRKVWIIQIKTLYLHPSPLGKRAKGRYHEILGLTGFDSRMRWYVSMRSFGSLLLNLSYQKFNWRKQLRSRCLIEEQ